MPLVRAGRSVEDRFVRILDDAPLPDHVPVLLPAGRFLADIADIGRRPGPAGVIWPNDRRIAELAPHLDRLAMVALEFPKFRDGRAYSQARQLRERHGFRGELRATGQILRDQCLFLLRAGFDTFEVTKEADVEHFIEAARRHSVFYQPSADGRPTASALRLRNPTTAAKTTETVR
jgi:uncharacterized protein (DUF934 family)